MTEVPTPPDTPSTLLAVRTSISAGYERVVFEFGGGRHPGYRVGYITPPAQECGSGADAPVAGMAVLSVRLQPAQAHAEIGASMEATIKDRDRAPRYPILRQLRLICDFEGSVEWVLGVSAKRPYRLLRLESPARLVVDIAAADR